MKTIRCALLTVVVIVLGGGVSGEALADEDLSSQHAPAPLVWLSAISALDVGDDSLESGMPDQEDGKDGKRSSRNLEEVVVTAQKREERMRDVPISITVLSGQRLDNSSDRGVADAINRVPGVINSVDPTTARNGSTTGVIIVRGVPPAAGASPSAYYLDSIPFGFVRRFYQPDATAYDLERVEVLKGPQGTLYGLSSLNGVVRVLTEEADVNELKIKLRTALSSTDHGSESYRGDMAINVPVVEGRLAARVVAGYQELGGWIDKSTEKDANDARIGNYRLKLNARPTDQLSMGLSAWFSRTEADAPANSADGLTNVSAVKEPSSTDYDAYSLRLAYDFSRIAVHSATSYIDFKTDASVDFSPFIADRYLNLGFYSQVFAQELLAKSNDQGLWSWSAGVLYRNVSDTLFTTRTVPETGALAPPYIAPTLQDTTSESFALFGEVTRELFDGRWDVTVGLRYFKDAIRDQERSRLNFTGGTTPPPDVADQSLVDTGKNRFNSTVPRVVVGWHPVETAMLYASLGKGFRSGLNQVAAVVSAAPQFPPAGPDTLTNYEIGAKGNFWVDRVSYELAAFYMDWQNVQQGQTVVIVPAPNLLIQPALINGGSASGAGFEIGASVMPMDGLVLGMNYSWNGLELDENVVNLTSSGGAVLFAAKGDRLAASPGYTWSASADYDFLVNSGYRAHLSASVNGIDGQISARVSPTNLWFIESVTLVRVAMGVTTPSDWSISLFVDNLTNEDGLAMDQFSPRWNTYMRPRTCGLQFEYRY